MRGEKKRDGWRKRMDSLLAGTKKVQNGVWKEVNKNLTDGGRVEE